MMGGTDAEELFDANDMKHEKRPMTAKAAPSTKDAKPNTKQSTKAPGPLIDSIDSAKVVTDGRLLVCMKEPKEFKENLGVDDKKKCTVPFITGNKEPGIIEVWGEHAARLNRLVEEKSVIGKPYTISMGVGMAIMRAMPKAAQRML